MPDAPQLSPDTLRLADAYHARLGEGEDARLILNDLRRQAFADVDAPLAPAAGLPIDPLQLALYEGARSLVRRVETMIRWSLTAKRSPETPKASTLEPPEDPNA